MIDNVYYGVQLQIAVRQKLPLYLKSCQLMSSSTVSAALFWGWRDATIPSAQEQIKNAMMKGRFMSAVDGCVCSSGKLYFLKRQMMRE